MTNWHESLQDSNNTWKITMSRFRPFLRPWKRKLVLSSKNAALFMAKGQREVEERNESGLLTLMRKLFTGYTVRRGEKYRKTITLSLTNWDSYIFMQQVAARCPLCHERTENCRGAGIKSAGVKVTNNPRAKINPKLWNWKKSHEIG